MSLDAVLRDPATGILLVCGSGGVGKTTVSAALGIRAADLGRKVAVLTIDPARRLATALGIDELEHEPRAVDLGPDASGRLDALMLDMKRAFDDAVLRRMSPERAAALLANPFYQTISSQFAGTQEYLAMERLGQLVEESAGRWDLIVVDTPPSVSALDFLDGPSRLTALLDSPALKLLTAPTRGSLRFLGVGVSIANAALDALVGRRSLGDLQAFVAAFDDLLGGLRDRARRTRALLSTDRTACVVVASPEVSPVAEASLLLDRLADEELRLAGVVGNRVEPACPAAGRGEASPVVAWARAAMAAAAGRRDAELRSLASLGEPVVVVERQPDEPTDVDRLRALGELLAGPPVG